ncbi:MAG TPA: TetR family transcriptional regulator [Acidimicrobiales bacterium]|nr:TetR family transcriptional regulator [Acidimicrobiales bacterium]
MAGGSTPATRSRRGRQAPTSTGTAGIGSDDVVDAALRIVEREGARALTMRRLAEELGTAVTAIYWHVGNRDALVDLLVARLIEDMGHVHATGRRPRARITTLAVELRERLLARPHLIALADQRGMTGAMFQPVQAALAEELAAMGITGRGAASVIQILQCHVVASVVLARAVDRSPTHDSRAPIEWTGDTVDPELVEALAAEPDLDAAFAVGLDALLDRLLPSAARPRGNGHRSRSTSS